MPPSKIRYPSYCPETGEYYYEGRYYDHYPVDNEELEVQFEEAWDAEFERMRQE